MIILLGYKNKTTISCQFGGHTAATQDQGLGASRGMSQNKLDQVPRQPIYRIIISNWL